MKTKVLLIAAASLAAGFASSMAQVTSENVVGYALATVPGRKQALLSNPLNNSNNNVSAVVPLANNAGHAGSAIFRYDSFATPPVFRDPIEWFDDYGWYSASDPNPILAPGEAFFFRNASSFPVTLTFVGDVLQGHLVNAVPGNNRLSFRGSQTPRALPLGAVGINTTNTLNFPADCGDAIFFWDNTVTPERWGDPFEYFCDYGWFAASGDQGPAGPVIHVGIGFAVRKAVGVPNKDWIQDYTVD